MTEPPQYPQCLLPCFPRGQLTTSQTLHLCTSIKIFLTSASRPSFSFPFLFFLSRATGFLLHQGPCPPPPPALAHWMPEGQPSVPNTVFCHPAGSFHKGSSTPIPHPDVNSWLFLTTGVWAEVSEACSFWKRGAGLGAREKEPLYTSVGIQTGEVTVEISVEVPWKPKINYYLLKKLLFDPAISILAICTKKSKSARYRDPFTFMLTMALFPTAKLCNKARCPSTDEWIKKILYTYKVGFYPAIKKNKIMPLSGKWMELETMCYGK